MGFLKQTRTTGSGYVSRTDIPFERTLSETAPTVRSGTAAALGTACPKEIVFVMVAHTNNIEMVQRLFLLRMYTQFKNSLHVHIATCFLGLIF